MNELLNRIENHFNSDIIAACSYMILKYQKKEYITDMLYLMSVACDIDNPVNRKAKSLYLDLVLFLNNKEYVQ